MRKSSINSECKDTLFNHSKELVPQVFNVLFTFKGGQAPFLMPTENVFFFRGNWNQNLAFAAPSIKKTVTDFLLLFKEQLRLFASIWTLELNSRSVRTLLGVYDQHFIITGMITYSIDQKA